MNRSQMIEKRESLVATLNSINETMKQLSREASELVGAIKLLNELVDGEEEDTGGGADAPHQDV